MLETDKESELKFEQKYFDKALDCRERARATLGSAPSKAPTKGAAANLRKIVERELERLRPPEEAVAFSRFDTNSDTAAVYVGYNAIWDDDRDLLVINWQAPDVSRLYEATPQEPGDVTRRRTFSCDGNSVLDFEDLVYALIAAQVAELVAPAEMDDALLSDLQRGRTGEMQDIVRTIQAAQHKVIRADLNQLLIVQGGPGTGKTAVALHRISWLLFNHQETLAPEDVLVVGPSSAFIRYIRGVLPMLGDQDVRHAQLPQLLATAVQVSRKEDPVVAHLKGEKRMEVLIETALKDRVRLPEGDIAFRSRGVERRLDRAQLRETLDRIPVFPYGTGRLRLRDALRDNVGGTVSGDSSDSMDAVVDRIWPQLTAAAFMQELLGSEGRLLRAAGDLFTAAEVQLLYRQSSDRLATEQWSAADVGLLDYADFLIKGETPRTYSHIVVDEVQDLSPLQLGMIRRRSPKGSVTALGDIAQSTGPWARDDWNQVLIHLDGELPHTIEELEYGYRVPSQIYGLAARLLPEAAPAVTPPRVVREGPSEPELIFAEPHQVAHHVVSAAREYASLGNFVGIVCPATHRKDVEESLRQEGVQWANAGAGEIGTSITLLDPNESKGLEFDAVVVAEPIDVIEQDVRGHRLLYVALTRPTRHLTVVYSRRPLPFEQESLTSEGEPSHTPPLSGASHEADPLLEALSIPLADQIRNTVQPHLWKSVVEEIERQLSD
jgi:DNA helicase IV